MISIVDSPGMTGFAERVALMRRFFFIPLILAVAISQSGCGGFVVDDGILPLPTIHLIFPTPDQYGIDYEQVELKTPSGASMFAWYVSADDARATVVINHGALFNRSSYAGHIAMFHDLGFNVMIADYRGFGESYEFASLYTVLDDANTALEYVRQRNEAGTDRIILYGISMGTMPSLAQAAAQPADVVGVIVEGVVQQELLGDFAFQILGIPPSPEAHTQIPASLDPLANAPKILMPKLFIQSIADEITPFIGAQQLFELSPEPRQLAPVTGIHGLSVYADPNYMQIVADFLDGVTGGE